MKLDREPIFNTVRDMLGRGFTQPEVKRLDAAIDEATGTIVVTAPKAEARKVGPKGIALMHRWEGCRLTAYPDPGSKNGEPWTIGWGSTGPGIREGVTWTQKQADERFERDLVKYAREVEKALDGAPTSQEQFDALVAFHYNTGAIGRATLTDKHRAGDYAGAAKEFGRWVKNDGRTMQGLVNRRADEAALYRSGTPR